MKDIVSLIREFPMGSFLILIVLIISVSNTIESCGKQNYYHCGESK